MPAQPLSPGSPQAQPVAQTPAAYAAEAFSEAPPQPAPVWLQRISLFILVLFCLYLGVIVTVLPWWTAVWDHNSLLLGHPRLWAVLRLGPVRGVISGFGLLDIWIGISEAVHYRDQRH